MCRDKRYDVSKLRRGFSLVEAGIVLVLVGVFVLGLFAAYSKLYLPMIADNEYQKITSLISGIDRVKLQNGNAYLSATNKPISHPSLIKLQNAMGGANAIKDIGGWTYDCASGAGNTITVKTGIYDTEVIRDILVDYINTSNRPWDAEAGASMDIIMRRPQSTCINHL